MPKICEEKKYRKFKRHRAALGMQKAETYNTAAGEDDAETEEGDALFEAALDLLKRAAPPSFPSPAIARSPEGK